MNRKGNLDLIRLLACFWIFFTHFIMTFHSEYFRYWSETPTQYFLRGITGKLGVAFFSVIMGYLAYSQGQKRKKSLLEYSVKRYLYFVICGLLINSLFLIAKGMNLIALEATWLDVIRCSFLLKEDVFLMLWWLSQFFVASIICYAVGKSDGSIAELVIGIILAMFMGKVWIAVALMGGIVYYINQTNFAKKRIAQFSIVLLLFILIQRPESTFTYFMDGLFASTVVLITENTKPGNKLFNNPLSVIGKNGMGIFMMHAITYQIVGPFFLDNLSGMTYSKAFLLSAAIVFLIVVLLSYPYSWCVNWMYKYACKLVDIILDKFGKKFTKCNSSDTEF